VGHQGTLGGRVAGGSTSALCGHALCWDIANSGEDMTN